MASFKLLYKERIGSRIRRHYDEARSPFRRLLENEKVPTATKIRLRHLKLGLDPFDLKANITKIQQRLIELQRTKSGTILYPGPSYPGAEEKVSKLFG